MLTRDVELKDDSPKELLLEKHREFLASYAKNRDGYEQIMVDYLRMSGMYWSATAMDIMGHLPDLGSRDEMLQSIKECQDPESGGISASVGHDPHMLYTLSAIQLLAIYDALNQDVINLDKAVGYIKSMQQPDGCFHGDKWGEVDLRFSFCALASLSLLGRLNEINTQSALTFIMKCNNMIDGGFGSRPGSETHAGLVYCALGSLSILGRLDLIDPEVLGWWLCERQLASGGLNGRPEKLPDLCYSWWVLSSLHILGRLDWINREKLLGFIMACQDSETGGFSDRPGNMVDPFHTCFGLTGLSLLSHEYSGSASSENLTQAFASLKSQIRAVSPVFCMPQYVIDRHKIIVQTLSM